jgi:SHS2 domain-containing protein
VAPTAPEAFEHAARALAEIMGVAVPGPGTRRTVQVSATDEPGVLVAFLNELIWLHEAESVGFAEIDVIAASDQDLIGEVETVTLREAPRGLGVKAATYHQLEVRRRSGAGVEVRVFLDV